MTKDIHLVLKHKDERFTLTKPLYWWCELGGDTLKWTIPANYRTDFASVPTLFHWFIWPYDPKVAIPAIVHDYLLEKRKYERSFCDKIFYKKMLDFGMPTYKAYIAYICVLIYWKLK